MDGGGRGGGEKEKERENRHKVARVRAGCFAVRRIIRFSGVEILGETVRDGHQVHLRIRDS